jgi:hypothetical protein
MSEIRGRYSDCVDVVVMDQGVEVCVGFSGAIPFGYLLSLCSIHITDGNQFSQRMFREYLSVNLTPGTSANYTHLDFVRGLHFSPSEADYGEVSISSQTGLNQARASCLFKTQRRHLACRYGLWEGRASFSHRSSNVSPQF